MYKRLKIGDIKMELRWKITFMNLVIGILFSNIIIFYYHSLFSLIGFLFYIPWLVSLWMTVGIDNKNIVKG